MSRRASIDVGSNSLLLTVVEDSGAVVHDEVQVVGLGRGLGDLGHMQPARRAHGAVVLAEYVATAAALGVPASEIRAVATSGARRAVDAPAFFAEIEAAHGLKVRTISGEEEARLSYLGALQGLELAPPPHLVVDLGGGSTELVLGSGAEMSWRVSLEVGAVRLTEGFIDLADIRDADRAALRAHLQAEMRALPESERPSEIIAVAGTATTLAAVDLGLERYVAERVHGHHLSVAALEAMADRLAAADAAERRRISAIEPKRGDFLMAGAEVLIAVCRWAGHEGLTTSNGGLRLGLLSPLA
ncbi:MAG: Ppx/GppA family phosphatase [Alphaproteobacteria bacterium]|nr:Ppx/GppA family phosphatase [Alphaproteobacteria bacterium]MCB9792602.1 Ppx/GppA family phosphatase [Alphaproteobacteria bacterium]